jgi:hypothetical protein
MTNRALPALLLFAACGGSPPPSTPVLPASPVDAAVDASPPPPPAVSVDGILTDGGLPPEVVAAWMAGRTERLGACLSGDGVARATEVSLILVGEAVELRVAWQAGAPVTIPCLVDILGPPDTLEVAWDTRFATAYAVIRTAPAGVELPPMPAPPERQADVKLLFCDLFEVSGADKEPSPSEKREIAIAYGRAHARHPRAVHLTLEVSQWSPAENADKLKRAIKAEGIKRCALQRF